MTNNQKPIAPHGGYRNLKSYQMAQIIYDLTVKFCDKFLSPYSSYSSNTTYTRTIDQMIQAARSGKQNIAEGSTASGTSKKSELKLIGVARASLEELLLDYLDFIRQRDFVLWTKDSPQASKVRSLAYRSNKTYKTYIPFIENPETAANTLACLLHQANYLLDRQLRSLEQAFLETGGFTERLYTARRKARGK